VLLAAVGRPAAPPGGPSGAPGSAAGPALAGVVSAPAATTEREEQAAARYWTPARMADATRTAAQAAPAAAAAGARGARPAWLSGNTASRGLRWTRHGVVARTTGKVFFTLGGTDYMCSGSVVESPRSDVVLTAAHCVGNGAGQWAANWTFIPGYQAGTEPYGRYTARRFFVSSRWRTAGAEQYDVAFVQVNAATLDGPRPHGTALPGGAPVAFAARQQASPADVAYVFGYPAEPPYSGLYPDYCAGPVTPDGHGSVRTPCVMTAGDSGGPWLAGFRPRQGAGTIVAVSTFKLTSDMHVLYGAVLGPAARVLYQQASVSPSR
jgi:V8-like Glu-specific endopeptidase